MTQEFDAEKATRMRRAGMSTGGHNSERGRDAHGIHINNPLLQLTYLPSRILAMEILHAVNDNILRNYVPGGIIEQSLWVLPTSEEGKAERELIKFVLKSIFSSWHVTFANGCGERIILRNPRDVAQEEGRQS